MTTKIEENKKRMAEQFKARQEKKKGVTFSVTQYQDMKADGLSDAKIVEKYNTNVAILNAWKKEHNLIGKHNVKTIQKEQGEPVKVKSTTNQPEEDKTSSVDYKMLCETKDKEIANLMANTKRQLADNQKLAEENERLHKKLQEPADTSLEEELHKWKTDHAEMSKRYIETRDDAVELSEKLVEVQCELDIRNSEYALLENQLANATKRIEDLKRIESDYQSLEALHENLKSEFNTFRARYHSIENELEEFKDTEKMLVSTMDRYVKLYARVDEVTA